MARIFVVNTNVVEGNNVDIICVVLEAKTHRNLHIYLCKNGIGVNMVVAQQEEAHFRLTQVRKEDSGNYSCVYSINKYYINNVTSTNEKSSIIHITGND